MHNDLDKLLCDAQSVWAKATVVPYTPSRPVLTAGHWWQPEPGAAWQRVGSVWWHLRSLGMTIAPVSHDGQRLCWRE